MFGSLGAPELIILFPFALIPFAVLAIVASSRGQSMHYVWLGLLGFLGMIIGLAIMLSKPSRKDAPFVSGFGQPPAAQRPQLVNGVWWIRQADGSWAWFDHAKQAWTRWEAGPPPPSP